MATSSKVSAKSVSARASSPATAQATNGNGADVPLCTSAPPQLPPLPSTLSRDRAQAIITGANKWVNGTVLHYYFFDDPARDFSEVEQRDRTKKRQTWVADKAQQDVVRWAFEEWKALGIGLEFVEVKDREEAEIRIGFLASDGSWSYIGDEILRRSTAERTMNFGWDLRTPHGKATALHEIGHTLGLPHEHQSPFSGIVWNEEAVYNYFSGSPNFWRRDTIKYNILDQLNPALVRGSVWDPQSIMQYQFGPGLIQKPIPYDKGVYPKGVFSEEDMNWVKQFYPPMDPELPLLKVGQSQLLDLQNGEQANFAISPTETRYYEMQTHGKSDTLLVLFEEDNGVNRYRTADDDSGEERNAHLRYKLIRDRQYVLRARLKYRQTGPPPALILW